LNARTLTIREHVTFYFWRHSNNFKTVQLTQNVDWSKYRFTVDYPEDLEVVKYIFNVLEKRGIFGYLPDIIDIINVAPEIKSTKK